MSKRTTRPMLVIGLTIGAVTAAAVTNAVAAPPVELVSVSTAGDQADRGGGFSVISDDGRYVAFTSFATNLSLQDTFAGSDVYVRDRVTGTTELISVGLDGTSSGGAVEDISADGRYVVFSSSASDLVADDTNRAPEVFLRDRLTGTTEMVAIARDGSQAQQPSGDATVSRDGRFVAFTTAASLDPERDSSGSDVFVRDRQVGTTELVSVTRAGESRPGSLPSISDSGRFVSFTSRSARLVRKDRNRADDVFVRDLRKGTTERVSVSSRGVEAGARSFESHIAGAGRFVVFTSLAGNLVKTDKKRRLDVFVHDRRRDKTTVASLNSRERLIKGRVATPSISADGRYVSFNAGGRMRDGGYVDSLYVRDRSAGRTTRLLSRLEIGAEISGDGSVLTFSSARGDLVAGDTNDVPDVFTVAR